MRRRAPFPLLLFAIVFFDSGGENFHLANGELTESDKLALIVNEIQPYKIYKDESQSPEAALYLQSREPRAVDIQPEAQNEGSLTSEIDELQRFGEKIKELTGIQTQEPSQEQKFTGEEEEEILEPTDEEKTAVTKANKPKEKKGEGEFVDFVDPSYSNKLRNKELLEKRVEHHSGDSNYAPRHVLDLFNASGSIAFMAFILMCCVISIVCLVGGMYYYNHVRTSREDPFDDFTRYSPAGPGRDKLKKSVGKAANGGSFVGELGDETLAYKAQLHHYQQTKQKIIGAEEGRMGVGINGGTVAEDDASDKSDDDADLEHNFSVYECPGLAPTGDIEVQNPNFVNSHHK